MKANELMIGDWVCYDGDTDYSCPVKIEGMDVSCGFCITSDRDDAGFNGVIPIPLTARILKKNRIDQDNCYLTNINDEYFQLHIEIDGVELFKRIVYIHELQHALRLCGLNDLADNLKV